MAITITAEKFYKDGTAQTTPVVSGDNKWSYVGMQFSGSTSYRYVLLLTCKTDTPISNLTLSITHCGTDNTDSNAYFGMYVTTATSNDYLTTTTGGETKLRFSKTSVDGGSWTDSGNNRVAKGTVTKNIPTGTFYIYIVPYNTSYHSYSSVCSIQMTDGRQPVAEGTGITIYKATLNNQSATTAGTAALWYAYNTYISPYYYYTDASCSKGLASSKITVPTKTGYTFGGYYTSTGGSGTQYITSGGVMTNNLYKQSGNRTLYAKWTAKTFTVTFDPNGGSVSTASKTVTYASTYGDLPTPTLTGHTFSGWYTAKSGGSKVTSSTTVSITAAQTLYARWTANEYTLTVDPNGGSYAGSTSATTLSTKLKYGTTTNATLDIPERNGYAFLGYYTAATGGTKVYDETGACVKNTSYWDANGAYKSTANLKVYAQWKANGLIYVGTGNGVQALQIYVGTGNGVQMLMPLVGNGSIWDILS